MSQPPVPAELIDRLAALRVDGVSRRAALPFGIGAIDGALAAGGLRLDGVHEVAGAGRSLDDEVAAHLFAAGIAARTWGPVLWVVRRRELFGPDLAAAGLAAGRVIAVEAASDAGVLAIMEAGLRHPALGAVVGEVGRAGLGAVRRAAAAAGGGRTIALLLRRGSAAGATAAATRWRVGRASPTGLRRARWSLGLDAGAEGAGGSWIVEACDGTGRCALPAAGRRGRPLAVVPVDDAAVEDRSDDVVRRYA